MRTSGFGAEAVARLVHNLAKRLDDGFKMVFISSGHVDLMRRYNASRRQHPLCFEFDLDKAIRADILRMSHVEALADIVIDSSGLTPSDLRRSILNSLFPDAAVSMPVNVMSFSYRYGLPETADQIIDMLFATNPHWNDDLRDLTELNKAVINFLAQDKVANIVLARLKQMLRLMLCRIKIDGRPNLTLAFSCTRGKHRPVWAAEQMAKWIEEQGYLIGLDHRELKKVVAYESSAFVP